MRGLWESSWGSVEFEGEWIGDGEFGRGKGVSVDIWVWYMECGDVSVGWVVDRSVLVR